MQYKFVYLESGRLVATEFSDNSVYSAMEVRGYDCIGTEQSKRVRPELQGHPIFKGLCGPMYDGDWNTVRYETKEAYALLSS